VRLAIADPPYLGRAEMLYGARDVGHMNRGGHINRVHKADCHPDAAIWDDPATHAALVGRLRADYDGWAIAMTPDCVRHYLAWVPERTRIAVWHDPHVMPTGSHPRRRWEAVLVYVPDGRRRVVDVPHAVGDVLTVGNRSRWSGFAGTKPPQWTRWVLDMLGYREHDDTVDDLFPGSGAVTGELAQRRLW
jgi:hypothetical protein